MQGECASVTEESSLPGYWDALYLQGSTPWECTTSPSHLSSFIESLPNKALRVLIPGCGSATELHRFIRAGLQVEAIDFSAQAVQRAQHALGTAASLVRQADFFRLVEKEKYDWVYERAFLCALLRKMRQDYATKMASLVREGGILAGFFYLTDMVKGPPYGITQAQLTELLGPFFVLEACTLVTSTVSLFRGHEYWQVWRRANDAKRPV